MDVLIGNKFSCGDFPYNDNPNIQQAYSCSSKNLDDALWVWGCLAIIFTPLISVCAALVVLDSQKIYSWLWLLKLRSALFTFVGWLAVCSSSQMATVFINTSIFLKFLRHYIITMVLLGSATLTVTLVIYSSFKASDLVTEKGFNYKTHTDQYSYFISAAYLSGAVLATVILVLFLVVICSLFYFLVDYNRIITRDLIVSGTDCTDITKKSPKENFVNSLVLWFLVAVLSSVSLVINIFYVIEREKHSLNSNELVVYQVFIALFSILYVEVVRYLIFVAAIKLNLSYADILRCTSQVLVFTNIGVPIISTIFSDSLCFKNALITSDDIYYEYKVTRCSLKEITLTYFLNTDPCLKYTTSTEYIRVARPFIYR